MKRLFALLFSALVLTSSVLADEGMFLPNKVNKLDWKKLEKMGLKLNANDILNNDASKGLNHTIIRLNIGGTGEFVSPAGLILTNHHVAFGAIRENSTEELNLLDKGFHAESKEKELKTSYTGQVTEWMEDVTSIVSAFVDTAKGSQAQAAAFKTIADSLAKKYNQFPERKAEVRPMNEGNEYTLIVYRYFNDIRLVYAPPKSIGEYGGETDNWMWPRHTGDFSFLRAYMSKDGKTSASHSEENVPYEPAKFLKISAKGLNENDFTFIMGYPGRTTRYRTSYEAAFSLNYYYPALIKALDASIKGMEEAYKGDEALEIEYASNVKGFYNTLKNFQGNIAGMKNNGLIEGKQKEEQQFITWVNAKEQRKAAYGTLLNEIDELYKGISMDFERATYLRWPARTAWWGSVAAIGKAAAGEKPSEEKISELTNRYMAVAPEINRKMDESVLRHTLELIFSLPADQIPGGLKPYLETQKAPAAAAAVLAKEVVASLPGADSVAVKAFIQSAIEKPSTPAPVLNLVNSLDKETAANAANDRAFNEKIQEKRKLLLKALAEFRGQYLYPDANFTLRFTYGSIKGYEPRDAVVYLPQTVFSGVIAKESGEEPFKNHPKLLEIHAKKDLGNWVDPRLKDVPVAFLTTNDITGGNSGSPVINGRGELIGCAFDGVWEALTGDWKFEDSANRTIAVDSRYVLFILDKFSGAKNILDELVIVR